MGCESIQTRDAFERLTLENKMNKKQIYALKMKLSSLNIRLIDARALNKPTEELQSKFDALLAKLRNSL